MKTSALPKWVLENNPKIFMGSGMPMVLLRPMMAGRTVIESGWLAFQLIRQSEFLKSEGFSCLFFNRTVGACLVGAIDLDLAGWEPVEFDGYGAVCSWKEANL